MYMRTGINTRLGCDQQCRGETCKFVNKLSWDQQCRGETCLRIYNIVGPGDVRLPNDDSNEANQLPMDKREVQHNQGNFVFEIGPIIKIFDIVRGKSEPSVKVLRPLLAQVDNAK